MLTTQEVCEVYGLPVTTLTEWVSKGYFSPAKTGGRGRGNPHRFTLMQAVGIAVAAALQRSDWGCAPAGVRLVVESFGNMSEEWLLKRFEEGNTHFMTVHQERPILQAQPPYEKPDVMALYEQVIATL